MLDLCFQITIIATIKLKIVKGWLKVPIYMLVYIGNLNHPFTIFSFIVAIIVIWKHRSNISRLVKGEEPKISKKNN